MKDMLLNIDIIWIRDDRVVGVEHDVPFNSDLDPSELPIYLSPGEVTGVLELAAGEANRLGIDTGSPVLLK